MRSLIIIAAVFIGCSPAPQSRSALQPFVAAAGYYGILDAAVGPTPAPQPTGCTEGCRCNGTGQEKSGDGISIVGCRCPENCPCKAKKAAPCQNGTCQWPTRSIVR